MMTQHRASLTAELLQNCLTASPMEASADHHTLFVLRNSTHLHIQMSTRCENTLWFGRRIIVRKRTAFRALASSQPAST